MAIEKDFKFYSFKVWTPDIVLYNSAGDGEQGREMRTLIQVHYHRVERCGH